MNNHLEDPFEVSFSENSNDENNKVVPDQNNSIDQKYSLNEAAPDKESDGVEL